MKTFHTTIADLLGATLLVAFTLATLPVTAEDLDFSSDESVGSTSSPGSPDWTVAFAPRLGAIVPTSSLGPFVGVGLEFDVFLPVLDKQLVAALDLSYTRPGASGAVIDARVGGRQTYDLAVDELGLALEVFYRFFPNDQELVPFAGLGLLVNMLQSNQDSSLPGANSETSTEVGVTLAGGVDWRLGPGFLVGELRFAYSALSHELTGDSNAGNVGLSVGYRIGF